MLTRPRTSFAPTLLLALLCACATSEIEPLTRSADAGDILDTGNTPPDEGILEPDLGAPEPDLGPVGPTPCSVDTQCMEDEVCDTSQGVCAPIEPTRCGDGTCDPDEDCSSCPADCGCSPNQTCDAGACECIEDCADGETRCAGADEQVCTVDLDGCGVFEAPRACASGPCTNGSCCDPMCGAKECGADACGGTCGTCAFSCDAGGSCTRQLTVDFVRTDCDAACEDAFDPIDPYIRITIANQSYERDKRNTNQCDDTLGAQNWLVGSRTFTRTELRNITVLVTDYDRLSSDDPCGEWTRVDVSAPGTKEITTPDGKVTVSLTTSL